MSLLFYLISNNLLIVRKLEMFFCLGYKWRLKVFAKLCRKFMRPALIDIYQNCFLLKFYALLPKIDKSGKFPSVIVFRLPMRHFRRTRTAAAYCQVDNGVFKNAGTKLA